MSLNLISQSFNNWSICSSRLVWRGNGHINEIKLRRFRRFSYTSMFHIHSAWPSLHWSVQYVLVMEKKQFCVAVVPVT